MTTPREYAEPWNVQVGQSDLRSLDSHRYSEGRLTADFEAFASEKLLPRIKFDGYKRDEKQRAAVQMLHNLVETGLKGAAVADSRGDHSEGAAFRKRVWDAIIAAGLARMQPGSELSKKVTRYAATPELLRLRERWELRFLVDLDLRRNSELADPTDHALVVVKSGKIDPATGDLLPPSEQKKPISVSDYIRAHAQPGDDGKPHPQAIENGMNYLRHEEDVIESINQSQLRHTWTATVISPETGRPITCPVNPCLRQVHCGKMFRAVRYYSFGKLSGQGFSKELRRTIKIDGEPVAEFDFSGMAPRMLYHRARLDPVGDVYQPERIFPKFYESASVEEANEVRDFVKRLTNICLNVSNRSQANSSAGNALAVHPYNPLIRSALQGDGFRSPIEVLDAIERVHDERVVEKFYTEVGIDLMTTDGRIMLRILMAFRDADKPILAIHDSVVCKRSDSQFAQEAMRYAYRFFFWSHEPVIKQSF